MLTQTLTRIGRRLFKRADPARGASSTGSGLGVVYVLIRAWNRPLYLWACLDSLYRFTRHPCRFVFIDNASTDPLVRQIAAGFERRGMFHAVHFMERNHADNQRTVLAQHRAAMGSHFALLDADIVVQQSDPDWLQCMLSVAERDPMLAAVGSALDRSDFIDPDWAQRAAPEMPREQIHDLIKAGSPERRTLVSDADLINPFPPAGRLLLLRTEAIDQVGLEVGNRRLCEAVRGVGYRVGIATRARHRHLSLLNFFDYPDYDFADVRRYLRGG